MTTLQIWLAILGMGVVTAATRAFFLIGGERTVLPPRVQRVLRYAPPPRWRASSCPTCSKRPPASRSRSRIMRCGRRSPASHITCGGAA